MQFDSDAFSSGQISSKIWLAESLEQAICHYNLTNPLRICIIGGWYGLINFILQVRSKISIIHVRSVDIDIEACKTADIINETWVAKNWQFKSLNVDANNFDYSHFDCVINTVIEHMDQDTWFNNISKGTLVALQSNDMIHPDHINNHKSLSMFDKSYPLSNTFMLKSKDIRYPDWNFKRFMKIGIK